MKRVFIIVRSGLHVRYFVAVVSDVEPFREWSNKVYDPEQLGSEDFLRMHALFFKGLEFRFLRNQQYCPQASVSYDLMIEVFISALCFS